MLKYKCSYSCKLDNFSDGLSARLWSGVLFFLCLVSSHLYAEERSLQFDTLSIIDGLSQATGSSIIQDSTGFIWIGTEDGLNRYDGYKFKTYRADSGDPFSISSNSAWTLLVDSQAVMWVGTYEGLNKFDNETDNFTSYKFDPNNPASLSENDVRELYEDSVGELWAGTIGGGLNRFDKATSTFIRYQHSTDNTNTISGNLVYAVAEDSQGVLWVGSDGGLDKFDREKNTFSRQKFISSSIVVMSIHQDSQQQMWVGTEKTGLFKFDKTGNLIKHFQHNPKINSSVSNYPIVTLYEDSQGILWVGTDGGGLDMFDKSSGGFVHNLHDKNNPFSLSSSRVRSLYEDSSGVFWVGTMKGVNTYHKLGFAANVQRNDPVDGSALNHRHVRSFLVDQQGALWVGAEEGGLSRTTKNGKTMYYRHDPANAETLANNHVYSLFEEKRGKVWVGTDEGFLNLLDVNTGKVRRYSLQQTVAGSILHGMVRRVLLDSEDNFWVGTNSGGLHLFDRQTGEFQHFHHEANNPQSLSNDRVMDIYEDAGKIIWVSTFGGGLNKFNRQSKTFTAYRHRAGDASSISHDYILGLYDDGESGLWIATYGGGISNFDRQTERFTHFDKRSGLSSDSIYGILGDDKGSLWLSHNEGLSRFNPKTRINKNYTMRDGIQSNEFNGGAYYKAADGKLFYGGIDGYNAFYPQDIRDNNYQPRTVFTDFQIFNKSIPIGKQADGRTLLTKPINETEEITLSYKDNVFSIEFAALSYVQSLRNQYAYRMEGFDNEWNYVDRRFVTYTALPPGEYVFKVKASNNSGVWNEVPTELKLIVTPPYWLAWWFRIVAVMSILIIVIGGYLFRVRSIRKRNKLLEAEIKLRTSELRKTRDALVESAHKAGMADTATAVLHNVGNLLNSVNTSTSAIRETIFNSVSKRFIKATSILDEKNTDLDEFMAHDARAKNLLKYYIELMGLFINENKELMDNTKRLTEKVSAIKETIALQQTYANGSTFMETMSLEELVEDCLAWQEDAIKRHEIVIVKKFNKNMPKVTVQKTKVVQILVNLFKNAEESMLACQANAKVLTLELASDNNNAYLRFSDSGIGIESARLKKIFSYGCTTKENGHGFGLHSSANYMAGMGGKIRAESKGVGQGAVFILSFPLQYKKNKIQDGSFKSH